MTHQQKDPATEEHETHAYPQASTALKLRATSGFGARLRVRIDPKVEAMNERRCALVRRGSARPKSLADDVCDSFGHATRELRGDRAHRRHRLTSGAPRVVLDERALQVERFFTRCAERRIDRPEAALDPARGSEHPDLSLTTRNDLAEDRVRLGA
jgi:hypothetical protein